MRRDFLIAILLAVAAIPIGVALMAAPLLFPDSPRWVLAACFYGGIGIAALLILAAFLVAIRDEQKAERLGQRNRMIPLMGMIFFGVTFLGCATWYFWPNEVGSKATLPSAGVAGPKISFQKYALFWIEIDKEVYQLGSVVKFLNLSDKPYLIKELGFDSIDWSMYPRGGYIIQRLLVEKCKVDLFGDNYIKPDSDAYFKVLFPIKLFMIVNGGESPELIIRGKWNVATDDAIAKEMPGLYSVYPEFISLKDWEVLRTSKATIQVDDLHFKPIPLRPTEDTGPYINYLVFNSDRTATIDNVYFARTGAVKGQAGIMDFIRGSGPPPLGIGWSVLGHTYYEVWSDPEKLALYNSLFPPGEDGLPRPFGFISGSEGEMAGPVGRSLAAPTTRAGEIMEINHSCGDE